MPFPVSIFHRGGGGLPANFLITLGTPTGAGIPWTAPAAEDCPAGTVTLRLQSSLNGSTWVEQDTGITPGGSGTFAYSPDVSLEDPFGLGHEDTDTYLRLVAYDATPDELGATPAAMARTVDLPAAVDSYSCYVTGGNAILWGTPASVPARATHLILYTGLDNPPTGVYQDPAVPPNEYYQVVGNATTAYGQIHAVNVYGETLGAVVDATTDP